MPAVLPTVALGVDDMSAAIRCPVPRRQEGQEPVGSDVAGLDRLGLARGSWKPCWPSSQLSVGGLSTESEISPSFQAKESYVVDCIRIDVCRMEPEKGQTQPSGTPDSNGRTCNLSVCYQGIIIVELPDVNFLRLS